MEDKVVKCNRCVQHFMHTEKTTKCPFCATEYVDVEDKANNKKWSTKTEKKSFKIWKDKDNKK